MRGNRDVWCPRDHYDKDIGLWVVQIMFQHKAHLLGGLRPKGKPSKQGKHGKMRT